MISDYLPAWIQAIIGYVPTMTRHLPRRRSRLF